MKILNSPYPLEENLKTIFVTSIFVGLFVSLFLYIFQPLKAWYDYEAIPLSYSLMFGFISMFMYLILNIVIPAFLKNTYQEDKWKVKNEILHNFVLVIIIALLNFAYTKYLGWYESYDVSNSNQLIQMFIITFLIGVFPIVSIVLIRQNSLLKRYVEQTTSINNSISKKKSQQDQIIKLQGEGKNELLEISIDDFIFVKSQANYCEIFIEGKEKTVLFRSSMANIFKQVSNKNTYKCHRSYIVNLKKVTNVTGNAQGLRLHFNSLKESVPVSRNLTNEIKQLLIKLN